MALTVHGLGCALQTASLKPGDLYVSRGNKHSLLLLAGQPANDPLDLLLAVVGDYFDDAKPPYQVYRSAMSGSAVRVKGEVEIRPLEGDTPFLQQSVVSGSLAIDAEGAAFARLPVGTWIDLATGAVVDKPKTVAEYRRWRIVWRDGDELVTLASFGDAPPKEE